VRVDSDRSVGQRVNGYSPLCLCVVLPVLYGSIVPLPLVM
jgi:hypothetical protein